MKHKILSSLFLALACAVSAFAETYNLVGDRYLRRYTAEAATPVYNASVDASLITEDLCKFPWGHSDVTQAVYTTHTDALLDSNIANRESFDAASFCARHTNATHVAYANAAVYRYELPDGTLPRLTNLAVRVFSDPYNRYGARIVLLTNSTGEIPTDCATVRGNVVGSIVATNVAKRLAYSINSEIKWYPAYSNLVFSTAQLGASGLQLQKYLFVFVLKENYSYVNGNWLEGSSYIQNKIEIRTDGAIPTWTDGATVNLSVLTTAASDSESDGDTSDSVLDEEQDANDVTEATKSPWYGKMVCYEDDMTVVKCTDAQTNVHYFAAPPVAYRRLHRYGTNLTSVTHAAYKYGTAWALGPATNVSALSGLTIVSVYPHQAVKLLHRAARDSRGYEYLPNLVDMTNSDVRLIASYRAAFGLGDAYFQTITNLAETSRVPLGWLLYTGATSAADTDGDGLDLVHEWDNGIYPTDPTASDTDGDTIRDDLELAFFIKGTDAADDFDGDGLSNYSEYLVTEVFGFADCDPLVRVTPDSTSTNVCCDYFKKVGELYLGELFQDHDHVSDAWERRYSTWANPNVWDCDRDDDGDGWDNFAECKAGTHPGKSNSVGIDGLVCDEMPVPIVRMNVMYASKKPSVGPLVVIAERFATVGPNSNIVKRLTSVVDARWNLGGVTTGQTAVESIAEDSRYVGRNPQKSKDYHFGKGVIINGTFKGRMKVLNYEKGTLDEDGEFFRESYGDPAEAEWVDEIVDRDGILYDSLSNVQVGTIDYETGLVTIDFGANELNDYRTVSSTKVATNVLTASGTTTNVIKTVVTRMSLADAHVSFTWKEKAVQVGSVATKYFSVADTDETGSHGWLRDADYTFTVFIDADGNGTYTAGEPLGCAVNVRPGFANCEFDVELTDTDAVTPRFDLWNSSVNDRNATFSESIANMLEDRIRQAAHPKGQDLVSAADAENDSVHVRIVRFGVNHIYAYALGVGFGDVGPNPIVVDRTYDRNGRSFLCEADFLQDGEFDLDWERLKGEVCDDGDVQDGLGDEVTNVTYLAVFEGGSGHEYWVRGSTDTSTVIRCASTTIERRFEHTKHAPVAANVNGICYGARPTFTWTLPNEEAGAKKYGTTYTAFNLEIYEQTGTGGVGAKIYESGVRRAPAQDASGAFVWTADLSVGDLTSQGAVFLQTGNYKWRVAMYNAKFKPGANDMWSGYLAFSTAVNSQQPVNAFGYSSIDVAVKYAGSPNVLKYAKKGHDYQDLTTMSAKVRVQAFATADFAGVPLAEAVVTEKVDALYDPSANVRLVGLPATGTYYLRAYIDSNGNHALDAWESWGAAAEPVALTTETAKPPVAGIWIEDSDTDGDWFPDALEYAVYGGLTVKDANVKGENATLFSQAKVDAAKDRLASISTTMEGSSLVIFENGTWAYVMLGNWGDKTSDITLDDIRAAVEEEP